MQLFICLLTQCTHGQGDGVVRQKVGRCGQGEGGGLKPGQNMREVILLSLPRFHLPLFSNFFLLNMDDDSPSKSSVKLLKLPLSRIKMIMRSSPELGSVSTEGYFLIARAAVSISLFELYQFFLIQSTNMLKNEQESKFSK